MVASIETIESRRSSVGTSSCTSSNTPSEIEERTEAHKVAGAETQIQYVIGNPPDLVIEVTSPGNKADAYGPKWKEFAFSGVKTYVIVDIAPTNIEMRSVIVGTLTERERMTKVGKGRLQGIQRPGPSLRVARGIPSRVIFYKPVA